MQRQTRAAVLAVEDNYVGGVGSELAEASAALAVPFRWNASGCGASRRAAGPLTTCSVMSACQYRISLPQRNGWRGRVGEGTMASR